MFDFTYELEQLQNGIRTPDLIKSIIEKHRPRAKEMKSLYDRYRVKKEGLPILTRELDDPMKINNKVNNDFFGLIVNRKIGYFAGTPVTYGIEEKNVNTEFQTFAVRNRLADLDAEVTKYAAICGYATRYIYTDKEGREKVVIVKPWESVLISENGIDETDFALRYYTVRVAGDKEELRVELHEPLKMTEFKGENESSLKFAGESKHVFDYCPMWGYENNEELLGDAEKVISEIDAYDRTVSDINSEIEAFRAAYLAFYGVEPPADETEEQSFSSAGTFYFREGQKAEFVTKVLQTEAVEKHLDRLSKDIHLFSATPDMSDDAFGGTVTGVAAKYKMSDLENKTATFERKFKSSSIRMFEILGSAFAKRRIVLNPYEVDMQFTRTFPRDEYSEAQTTTLLKGQVSDETRLALLSFVENAKDEIEKIIEERYAYPELDPLGGGLDVMGGNGTRQAGAAGEKG